VAHTHTMPMLTDEASADHHNPRSKCPVRTSLATAVTSSPCAFPHASKRWPSLPPLATAVTHRTWPARRCLRLRPPTHCPASERGTCSTWPASENMAATSTIQSRGALTNASPTPSARPPLLQRRSLTERGPHAAATGCGSIHTARPPQTGTSRGAALAGSPQSLARAHRLSG